MLSSGDGFDHRSAAMEVRQYIRPDVTLSAIVHLSLVAFVVIYTEVRPFRSVAEKTVPVDVIVADEKKLEPLPTPEPSPDLSMLARAGGSRLRPRRRRKSAAAAAGFARQSPGGPGSAPASSSRAGRAHPRRQLRAATRRPSPISPSNIT